ncbi:MAG: BolA family protein [Nannocystaceae bacterium]
MSEAGPVEQALTRKLAEALQPAALEVINESHMHSVAPGSETHFKVVVASDAFAGLNPVARHRKVHNLLAEEIAGPIHAISIIAWTPDVWRERRGAFPASPKCLGGSKAD